MSGSAWDCDRGYVPTVAFWFDGWRHGVCRLLEGDMAYVAFPSRLPRRRLTDVTGVLCVSTALAVSVGCDGGCVAFWFPWRHGVCRLLSSVGLKPGRLSPSPSLAPPLSPSLSLALSEFPAVLGCLPYVEGSCSCRAVRGGDVSTYEKAPTGAFFAWR
ncbi:hypothetical protein Taro_050328 [Colocasia esculenta]|uniref:Uncharacterized protein n=1 Tax=Colocasia esculenta TaxID=4460 RepID=A0A843XDJ1_COLES|nr:hypothetical protein [Colocasia esculenta]